MAKEIKKDELEKMIEKAVSSAVEEKTGALMSEIRHLRRKTETRGLTTEEIHDHFRKMGEYLREQSERINAIASAIDHHTVEECPSCKYDKLEEKPKYVMMCPDCEVGYNEHEVNTLGFKHCPICGSELKEIPPEYLKKTAKGEANEESS